MNSIPAQIARDPRWEQWRQKHHPRDVHAAEAPARVGKLITIALLFGVLVFWSAASEHHLLVRALVALGALAAAARAYALGSAVWIALFGVTVAAWNPVAPLFPLAGPAALGIVIATGALFIISVLTRTPLTGPARARTR